MIDDPAVLSSALCPVPNAQRKSAAGGAVRVSAIASISGDSSIERSGIPDKHKSAAIHTHHSQLPLVVGDARCAHPMHTTKLLELLLSQTWRQRPPKVRLKSKGSAVWGCRKRPLQSAPHKSALARISVRARDSVPA
jgi:hypothetical protein